MFHSVEGSAGNWWDSIQDFLEREVLSAQGSTAEDIKE